jgi:hypothetical protein
MSAEETGLRDEIPERGVELRRAAGDVQCGETKASQCLHDLLHRLAGHDLCPGRAGVDMAMLAGLVAELADVHLERFNPGSAELLTVRGQLCFKVGIDILPSNGIMDR